MVVHVLVMKQLVMMAVILVVQLLKIVLLLVDTIVGMRSLIGLHGLQAVVFQITTSVMDIVIV